MARMINVQTMQYEDVANPHEAYKTGNYTYKKGSYVPVINPDGNEIRVEENDLGEAINRGYRIVGDEDRTREALKKEYGEGLANKLGSFSTSFVKGLTFHDLTKSLFNKSAYEALSTPEELAKAELREEYAGKAPKIAGEVTAFIPKAGPSIAMKLGGKAFLKATPKIIKSTPVLSKLYKTPFGKKLVEGVAKSSGEVFGASFAMGAPEITDEKVIGTPEENAEAFLAQDGLRNFLTIGKKAAFDAAVLGPLFGGGGVIVKEGTLGALKGTKNVAKKIFPKNIQKSLAGFETDQILKSTGAKTKEINWIEKYSVAGGKYDRVAQIIKEEKLLAPGKSYKVRKEAFENRLKQYGKELSDHIKKIDEGAKAKGITTKFDDFYTKVHDLAIKPLKESDFATHNQFAKRIEAEVAKFKGKWEGKDIPFSEMVKHRRQIGDLVKQVGYGTGGPDNYSQFLNTYRWAVKVAEEELASKVATALGEKTANRYKFLKERWQVLDWGTQALGGKVKGEYGTQYFGLTDKILGTGGGVASMITGGGFSPRNILAGIGTSLASREVRRRGSSVLAAGMGKFNSLNYLASAKERMNKIIDVGVKSIFLTEKALTSDLVKASAVVLANNKDRITKTNEPFSYESFKTKVASVKDSVKDMETTSQLMDNYYRTFSDVAPETSKAAMYKTLQSLYKLVDEAPSSGVRDPFFPDQEVRPPDSQVATWLKKWAVVNHPESILSEIYNGTITNDQVEFFKNIYPQMYKQISMKIVENIGTNGGNLSNDKKNAIRIFLQMPRDYSLVQMMQASYAMGQGSPLQQVNTKSKQPKYKPEKVEKSEQVTTDTQKALISLP